MDSDEKSRTHADLTEAWATRFLNHYGESGVEKLASTFRKGERCRCVQQNNGSFNLCFKVLFDDGQAWAVRFPIPGRVMHTEEKVRREAAIIRFLGERTKIPVPELVVFGAASDNHDPEIGPFLITKWMEGVSLASVMERTRSPGQDSVLREDIDDETLSKIYSQMASILLELSSHDFDGIGALAMSDRGNQTTPWSILARPMTLKMNEIQAHGYVVVDDHRLPPFRTASEYMSNLIQQNIWHVYRQKNSVDDREDARRKYILRQRMKALVPHFPSKYNHGPFKLFCDDLRPGNILVDEHTLKITAIIDWEWTYTAPYEFSCSPPSWLILEEPTSWITRTEALYREKLTLFLKCLQEAEKKRERETKFETPQEERLSTLMHQAFEDGTFWYVQLLRQSFNFDEEVLWPNLETLLRQKGLCEVGMPSEEEIEAFVALKMKDLDDYNREPDPS